MCFEKSLIGKNSIVRKAQKNIKCYKLLRITGKKARSPYQHMIYFNSLTYQNKSIKSANFEFMHESKHYLYDGLHSYSNKKYICKRYHKIFEGYIPKGTRYYYNPIDHEYVSEKLIVYNNIIER